MRALGQPDRSESFCNELRKYYRPVPNPFFSLTIRGHPVAHAQCSSRTATISLNFDLRTATCFPRFISLAVNFAKISPNAIITVLLSSTHCTLVSSLDRSACFLFSLPLLLARNLENVRVGKSSQLYGLRRRARGRRTVDLVLSA